MDGGFTVPVDGRVAYINRIGTAVPDHDVHDAFLAFAATLLPERERRVFNRMADRSGIEHRFSCLRPDPTGSFSIDDAGFYRRGSFPSTGARMVAYETAATALALRAIAAADIDPAEVTHLIVASCTGFSAPGLDQLVAQRLGMRADLERTMIGFMGCYAAVPALRAARHIVRSEPSARVLVLNLELCTLHLQETNDLETVLSFMLFGDGAAACMVSAEAEGIALDGFRAQRLPQTESLITWRIGDQGFDMHLSGQVPPTIGAALRAERARNEAGWLGDTTGLHWAVHAGGRTVLDAVEQGLGLDDTALSHSREVLRDIGNVSSATLPHVLSRLMGSGAKGPGMAMAFGPGLSAETFRFRLV